MCFFSCYKILTGEIETIYIFCSLDQFIIFLNNIKSEISQNIISEINNKLAKGVNFYIDTIDYPPFSGLKIPFMVELVKFENEDFGWDERYKFVENK